MASNPLVISATGGLKELPLVTTIGATGSDSAIPSEQAVREAIVEPLTDIDCCGFVSHAQTSLSFSDTTYTLTLTDTGGGWQYYRAGVLCTVSGNKTVTLAGSPPAANVYYIYLDANDGTLTASTTAWTLQDSKIPVAIVIWNNSNTPKYWLCDERHTCLMDRRTHLYLHSTRGTQLVSGATLSGLSVKPTSPADTDNTPGIAAATIADEDLYLSLASLTEGTGTDTPYSVWFKASGAWAWEASAMPYRYTSSGYIQYDAAGTMTQGQASKYYNWYLVCTNVSGAARFGWFAGKGEFASAADAYAENPANFDWSGIPLAESVVVWQVTWESSNSYSTKGKCRLTRDPQRVNVTVTTAVNQSNLAAGVATDTTNFNTLLSATDTTVQRALDTLDNHTHGDAAAIPAGTIWETARRTAPDGWLLLQDGAAVSRSTYATLFDAIVPSLGTFTVTIASPAVISLTGHGFIAGDTFYVTTTGALPTGMAANTLYKVSAEGYGADAFQFEALQTADVSKGVATVSLAAEAVITRASHGLAVNAPVYLTTTGALPTGMTASEVYYIHALSYASGSFKVSRSAGNPFTVSIASPAVISQTAHGLSVGDSFYVSTTGALPTGMTALTQRYYVISAGFGANAFQFSTTSGGAAVTTSGSQSGTHTMSVYTQTVGAMTVTIASPAVVSLAAHGLSINDAFTVTTTGALPTGLTAGTTYYVSAEGYGADAFQFAASPGGSAITTSGSQSGTHTLRRGMLVNTNGSQGGTHTLMQVVSETVATSGSQSGTHTLRACPYGLGDGSTTFNLPSAAGRSPMGSGQGSGLTARTLGTTLGEEGHALTVNEMPEHGNHASSTQVAPWQIPPGESSNGPKVISLGSNAPHNTVHPVFVVNYIIKT